MATVTDLSDRTRVLPAKYYIDAAILAREKEALFFSHWQYACHAQELKEPGSYQTLSIFNQDLFLVRSQSGEIKGYFNVCPHRGHTLLSGHGTKRAITCPYHAWNFNLDGELLTARGSQTNDSFSKSEICLFPVRVEMLLDFVFVNLNPNAVSLAEFAPGLADQIRNACPEILAYQPVQSEEKSLGHSYICDSNWKVMIDNYLECYHCETAHKSFNDMMDIPGSRFDLFQNYTFQVAPTAFKEENKAFPLNLEHDVTTGHFWFLFPNTVMGQFPGVPGFYISRFDPLTPDKTDRVTTSLTPAEWPDPDAQRRDQLRADWTKNVVAPEDKALCENVQRGMHQLPFKAGHYITSPDAHNVSEHAMRYFHDLYLNAMEAES